MKLKCPKNSKHDGFVQTVRQVTTRFMDAEGKQYSFPSHELEKGRIFCVICGSVAAEVEDD
jgi:hypothetical protein